MRRLSQSLAAIGLLASLAATSLAANWTGGSISLDWELAPPSTAAKGEEFDATAACNYNANMAAGKEWEYGSPSISFEWAYPPDGSAVGAGSDTGTGGSGGGFSYKSQRTVVYNTASAAVDDKTVKVRAHVTGTIIDYGPDEEKGTADDVTYTIDEWSDWLEADLTTFAADVHVRDWKLESGEWVPDWTTSIVAVAGDLIRFRAFTFDVTGLSYAWDWDDHNSSDDTDANGDGVDEMTDDTESTFREGYHEYAIPFSPPYSHEYPRYKVYCSVTDSDTISTGLVTVSINEAYVCSGNMTGTWPWGDLDDWEQDAMNADVSDVCSVLGTMRYRNDSAYAVNFYDVEDSLFPFYNIFYYVGHGSGKPDGDDTNGYFNNYFGDRVSAKRKSHRTPMNHEREYRLVFINACNSASWNFKNDFASDCFVGWIGSVKSAHARAFSYYFWRYLRDGYSAYGAVVGANAATIGYRLLGSGIPQCQGNIILKKD